MTICNIVTRKHAFVYVIVVGVINWGARKERFGTIPAIPMMCPRATRVSRALQYTRSDSLKVRLHTAISRADFVSWWML